MEIKKAIVIETEDNKYYVQTYFNISCNESKGKKEFILYYPLKESRYEFVRHGDLLEECSIENKKITFPLYKKIKK